MTTESTSTEDSKKLRGRKKNTAPEEGADIENIAVSFSEEGEKTTAPQPPVKRRPGRPSSYTKETADEICRRIAEGESLRRICFDDHIPDKVTILRWLQENGEFRTHYTRAREDQAESFFDEAIDIAREHEDPQKARVIVDTLKWAAGKLKPKKYGDKIEHEVKTDFIPLDELRRRIEESKARRASLELEENKLLTTGGGG